MNYLAHAYLSFNHSDILIGNMISDFVKGKKQYDYPAQIQKGIRLHRAIDTFTDDHPSTKAAKLIFKPAVGAYSGAFMDIVYDHFLALDPKELKEEEWKVFSVRIYAQLYEQQSLLPEKFGRMLPYMKEQDWLYHYRFKKGIENSFGGLVRRAKYLEDSRPAFELFLHHYEKLQSLSADFFPEVKAYASSQFQALIMH